MKKWALKTAGKLAVYVVKAAAKAAIKQMRNHA